MKRQVVDLMLILVFFGFTLIKDVSMPRKSMINVIEKNFDVILNYKLNDYEYLRKINNIKTNYDYKCVTTIKKHTISDFYKYITLYNNNCKTKTGDIVLNEKGMIGVVTKVSKKEIKTMLLTNPKSTVSVRIGDTYGSLTSKNGNMIISDINNYSNVNIGDVIHTSGLTNIPNNIPIGRIKKISKEIIYVDLLDNRYDNPYVLIIGDNI